MEKQLINITDWNEREVRIELFGNGHYILKEDVSKFIKDRASDIALEVTKNMEVKS